MTGADGKVSVELPAGNYTVIETAAPGNFTFPPPALVVLNQDKVLDRRNVPIVS